VDIGIAAPHELETIAKNFAAPMWRELAQPEDFNAETWLESWKSWEHVGTAMIFVARENGLLLGALGVVFYRDLNTGRSRATELLFYVDPAERRRGVGRALLEAFERVAKQRGASSIIGSSPVEAPTETVLGDLYLASGFEELEKVYIKRLWQ
jgi:GNAT superfamily N-acetyltransferase